MRFRFSRFFIFAVWRATQNIWMHLCDGTYFKMTTFQVKTVTNIRFSNRKEDEWIKSADVTFSIVVFTNALTIPSFRGFLFSRSRFWPRKPRKEEAREKNPFNSKHRIVPFENLQLNRIKKNKIGIDVVLQLQCH